MGQDQSRLFLCFLADLVWRESESDNGSRLPSSRLGWRGGGMQCTMTPTMGKKNTGKKKDAGQEKPAKEVLYVEMEGQLKQRLRRLAELPHRNRKITAEAIMAIRRYVEEEE